MGDACLNFITEQPHCNTNSDVYILSRPNTSVPWPSDNYTQHFTSSDATLPYGTALLFTHNSSQLHIGASGLNANTTPGREPAGKAVAGSE